MAGTGTFYDKVSSVFVRNYYTVHCFPECEIPRTNKKLSFFVLTFRDSDWPSVTFRVHKLSMGVSHGPQLPNFAKKYSTPCTIVTIGLYNCVNNNNKNLPLFWDGFFSRTVWPRSTLNCEMDSLLDQMVLEKKTSRNLEQWHIFDTLY